MLVERPRHKRGAACISHLRQRLQGSAFRGKRGEDASPGAGHADRRRAGSPARESIEFRTIAFFD